MARQPRIEYRGAFYHVMARGNRREAIVESDRDRELFVATMGEACARAGWRVHGWVLMGNHYHLLLETPQANLVAGMGWFQNTYTRRFNVRNRRWGHLFGGRYKAVLVEPNDGGGRYFLALLDYIHLNPVRAGMVELGRGRGLLDHRWGSLSMAYGVVGSNRAEWMEVGTGLGVLGLQDRAGDRRRFVERLEGIAGTQTAKEAGWTKPETQNLQSTLRRGWYWGSEALKERLIALKSKRPAARSRDYRLSQQERDHGEFRAEQIVAEGLAKTGLAASDLANLKGSDPRKVSIAARVWEETCVTQSWIAARLSMGSAGNVSQQLWRRRNDPGRKIRPRRHTKRQR